MKSRIRRTCAVGVLGIASMGLFGCGADPSDATVGPDGEGGGGKTRNAGITSNHITGSVGEWHVDTDADKAEAGEVIFAIANFGTIQHEFLVVKTDLEPGKIPLDAEDGTRFSEDNEALSVVDEIPEFAVHTAQVLKVNLEPGKYQLLCNIAGHYEAGMHKAFEVVPSTKPTPTTMPVSKEPASAFTGEVAEWKVSLDGNLGKAGDITFTMTNKGTIAHEFLVVKTDFPDGKIPLDAEDGTRFSEDNPKLTVVDEIPEWPVGETGTLKVKLDPGKYQLLCNIAGHYAAGMHMAFSVE